jgi:hypothetical protein
MKLQLPNVTLLGIDCINVERIQAALDASQRDIEFGAVKLLTSLPTDDPRLVVIPHIDTIEEYSRFCIEELTKYVDTEYLIMIQYDGFVLNADKWNPEFLNYDYIGAPLKRETWQIALGKDEILPDHIVGNGGFTLRSKKFLDLCAKFVAEGKIERMNPEDAALCWWYRPLFEAEGMKWPTPELARTFAFGDIEPGYVQGFGYHGFYSKNIEAVIANYPGYPTHFFIPRIAWGRMQVARRDFKEVAIDGYYQTLPKDVGIGNDIWMRFKDAETLQKVWEEREEYFAKMGDIAEHTTNGYTAKVIFQTSPGLLTYRFHFCDKDAVIPEGAKQLFGN